MKYNGLKYKIRDDYETRDDHIVITGYTQIPEGGKLIIPETIDGLPVTEIGDEAFKSCLSLRAMEAPGVIRIGNEAFFDCRLLASVDMPGVKTIGRRAFSACSTLTSVSMPVAEKIGMRSFSFCSSLKRVDMPNIMTIGQGAFRRCIKLSELRLGVKAPVCEVRAIEKYTCTLIIRIPKGAQGYDKPEWQWLSIVEDEE